MFRSYRYRILPNRKQAKILGRILEMHRCLYNDALDERCYLWRARQEKGSRNREKTRRQIARLHYRIANIRRDTLHKATSGIVAKTKPDTERPCAVVLEDLNVSGMLHNPHLARAIADGRHVRV